jgi:hypothetical protein
VHKGKRDPPWLKCLLRETEQDRGVFSDRIEKDRPLELCHDFTQDVDTLCLEVANMAQRVPAAVDCHGPKIPM